MSESKRYYQIDVLYSIGVLLVILGHSHYSDWNLFQGTLVETVINYIYTFHMPLFFFIAGFLFLNSHAIEKLGYWKWIFEKAKRLLTPYFVLSIIAIVPKYFLDNGSFAGMANYSLKALLEPRTGVWGHFWFIPVLLFMYAIFGILKSLHNKFNNYAILTITFIVTVAVRFIPFDTDLFALTDIKNNLVFFSFGMIVYCINSKRELVNNKVVGLTIGLIMISLSMLAYRFEYKNAVMMFIIAFDMIIALWCVSCTVVELKIIMWISKHNFTIYIYSWLFQAAIMMACEKISLNTYLTTLVMFVCGLALPVIVAILYEKLPKLHNKFFDLLLGVK